jgi:hypothetical protein
MYLNWCNSTFQQFRTLTAPNSFYIYSSSAASSSRPVLSYSVSCPVSRTVFYFPIVWSLMYPTILLVFLLPRVYERVSIASLVSTISSWQILDPCYPQWIGKEASTSPSTRPRAPNCPVFGPIHFRRSPMLPPRHPATLQLSPRLVLRLPGGEPRLRGKPSPPPLLFADLSVICLPVRSNLLLPLPIWPKQSKPFEKPISVS